MNSQEVINYECPYRKSCQVPKEVNRCNTPRHLDCTIYQKYENLKTPRQSESLNIGSMVEKDLWRLE